MVRGLMFRCVVLTLGMMTSQVHVLKDSPVHMAKACIGDTCCAIEQLMHALLRGGCCHVLT